MTERLPLSGVRVVDLATFIAGPFTASVLGEFGAEIIKVEQPRGGDPLRAFGAPSKRGDGYTWLSEQRNKKSVTLDLRRPEGVLLLKRLAAAADIVCENFRPGTLERWGVGPDVLQAVNPGLIVVRISGYGQTGPYRDRPGFARIAHAFGGLTHLTGVPGGPPLTPGSTSLADYISGLYGAVGALMALRDRERTGRGQTIDMALYEAVFRVLDETAPLYAASGFVRPRLGRMTSNVCPHGHFECGDGGWVAIACTSDKIWGRMAALLGRAELAADMRYATSAARVAHRDEVDGMVTAYTLSLPRDKVVEACNAAGVPTAAIYSIADIFEDPHYRARGTVTTVVEPETGEPISLPGVLPALSETPGRIATLGPRLGAHNAEVYGGLLGISAAGRAALRRKGAI